MSDERLYNKDEVRRIFEAASAEPANRSRLARGDALTLRELQEIGDEVGLQPERIAEAAHGLDSPRRAGNPLGIPITVRRTVDLPRAPTAAEWEILLGEIRETFDAPGQARAGDTVFEWRNGNLHIYFEPTVTGYRLRMGTRKGSAVAMGTAGLAGMGWGTAAFIGMTLAGNLADGIAGPMIMGGVGAGTIGAALLRLPRWARARREQMDYIAARALALLGPDDESSR